MKTKLEPKFLPRFSNPLPTKMPSFLEGITALYYTIYKGFDVRIQNHASKFLLLKKTRNNSKQTNHSHKMELKRATS